MPIDLSAVNWLYVALMAAFAFVAALLGSLISFRNRIGGALLAGHSVRRHVCGVELLSAPADPAADRRRPTPIPATVDLSAGTVMRRSSYVKR